MVATVASGIELRNDCIYGPAYEEVMDGVDVGLKLNHGLL